MVSSLLVLSSDSLAQSQLVSGQEKVEYVPGEILVKFKPSASSASIVRLNSRLATTKIKDIPFIKVQHLKIPEGMSVEEAVRMYQSKPEVEYAQPNYIYHALLTPNDTSFEELWGLHNTGQTVNGTAGTADCDIDALEAWDITTGSSNVVIAVIDTGVDYNHPDLTNRIWTNSGEIAGNGNDDDNNDYVDDIRGWDFVDNDNDPMDSHNHGTHVAGTIAAQGNNADGITGVNWDARIMPLRFLNAFGTGTTASAVSAIQYAYNNGAKVLNNSWGGGSYDQTLKDAITASHTAGTLFVAAAGNDGTDNDTSPEYPASYDVANIIAVAATNQNDALASWSNYGATTVDVAAPGVNIYSAQPARQTVWSDNFDDGDISNWTTGGTNNTWGLSSSIYYSSSYSLTDSPSGNYQNNTASWARAPVVNLSSHSGAKLAFKLRGISESGYDFLYVQTSTSTDGPWTDQDILIGNYIYSRISGTSSGSWLSAYVDLGAYDGSSTVYVRFYFTADSSNTYDGWYIDDVTVTTASSSYAGTEYQFLQGTSMSAPHVSGLAALIWARHSSLSNTSVKSCITNGVDSKAGLSGKMVTGGRINAYNSFIPAAPSSLSATQTSSTQIDLSWTDNSPIEDGFKIERKLAGGTYSQIDTVGANVTIYSDTTVTAGNTYYYRVRAYNSDGNSSYSNEATPPTGGGDSGGGGGGGGCLIATAAYGTPMAEEEKILCEFRDRYLLTNRAGRTLVSLYNRTSPPVANFIRDRETLKKLVRFYLKPVAWAANKLIRK